MNKERGMTLLRERGAHKAAVQFNGGNDEGGVEDIIVFTRDANGEEVEIALPLNGYFYNPKTKRWEKGEVDEKDNELWNILEEPVDERYGGFGFEGYVSGTYTWDVEANTVTLDREEQEYVSYSESY